jgi:hypothetical protein
MVPIEDIRGQSQSCCRGWRLDAEAQERKGRLEQNDLWKCKCQTDRQRATMSGRMWRV